MTRKFIICHLLTVIAYGAGCTSNDNSSLGAATDMSSVPDSSGDGGAEILDTHETDVDTEPMADVYDAQPVEDVGLIPDHMSTQVPCNVAQTITCGETVVGGSNGGDTSTKVLGWYACQPEVKALYAVSPEKTYRFVAETDVRVTVTETTETSVDLFAIKDEGEGCAASANACVAGDSKSVSWNASAGEAFYVVLDDRDGGEHEVDITVSCCEPECEGRLCGSDGCGGSCGACEEGLVCDSGECVDGSDLPCLPTVSLSCGDTLKGETFLSGDATVSVETLNCTNEPLLGPERAYALNVPKGGLVSVAVDSNSDEVAGVFLLDASKDACDTASCVTSGANTLAFLKADPATYTLLVEGKPEAQGTFDVEVACCTPSCGVAECGSDGCGGSCGSCIPGFVCADGECMQPPAPVCEPVGSISCNQEPVALNLDDGGAHVVFTSPCIEGDLTGPEKSLHFVPEMDSNVSFSITSTDDKGNHAVILTENHGLECMTSECVAGGLNSLTAAVSGGQAYYVTIDGLDGSSGTVQLSAACCAPDCDNKACGEDGCGGSCGSCGDDLFCVKHQCEPMPVPMCKPAKTLTCGDSFEGKIKPANAETSSIYGYSCNPFDYSGSEVAYALVTPKAAKVGVSLTPDNKAGELDVFLIHDQNGVCHSDNCQAWGDTFLSFQSEKAQLSYIVVDGFMGGWGAYTLDVACCFPACENAPCGQSDGCGGTCGCTPGNACVEGKCLPPSTGNSCSNPWTVAQLPYTKAASSDGAFLDSLNTGMGCGTPFEVGMGVADVVYAYTATESGMFEATMANLVSGASPAVMYALADCESPKESCLAYGEAEALETNQIIFPLVEGETVYIVLDGITASDTGAFTFTLDGPLP